MQKTIYIVRHGETELNRNRIIQGSGIDASLNDTGHKQAKAFHNRYADRGFDVVLTSALRRTHETMGPFIDQGLPWEQFPEINEMGWGIYEGKSSTPEMKAAYKEMLDAWKSGDYEARIPGGESAQQLADRLFIFVEHLKQRQEENILVCSHGRAMRCLMTLLQRQELSEMDQYHHSNTGLYLVDYQPDEFVFQLENDLAHLEGTFPQKA
jgi:probable phosphoglycerate mutase